MDTLDPKYILDGPSVLISHENLYREVPGQRQVQWFQARIQAFELTYFSDYLGDHDKAPFSGALEDSEANALAREMLGDFVEEHRLAFAGRVIRDQDVDGAEPLVRQRRHRNEFTIYYEIVEDLGPVEGAMGAPAGKSLTATPGERRSGHRNFQKFG
jgi:hypothetical protein